MIFFFCFVIELPNNPLHFFKMFLFFYIVQNQTQMFTVFRIRKKYGNILIFRYQRLFLRVFLSLYQFNQFRLLAILLSSPICCPFDRFSSIRFSGLLCRNGDQKKNNQKTSNRNLLSSRQNERLNMVPWYRVAISQYFFPFRRFSFCVVTLSFFICRKK